MSSSFGCDSEADHHGDISKLSKRGHLSNSFSHISISTFLSHTHLFLKLQWWTIFKFRQQHCSTIHNTTSTTPQFIALTESIDQIILSSLPRHRRQNPESHEQLKVRQRSHTLHSLKTRGNVSRFRVQKKKKKRLFLQSESYELQTRMCASMGENRVRRRKRGQRGRFYPAFHLIVGLTAPRRENESGLFSDFDWIALHSSGLTRLTIFTRNRAG